MASETETVVSTPPTNFVEEVKEKLYEEVHPTKHDSPPKQCDEQAPKYAESPNVECSLAKSEEETDNFIGEPPTSVTSISEPEEKKGDIPIVSSVVKEDTEVTHVPEAVFVTADVKQEEQPSVVDVPISSVETVEIAEEPLKVTSTDEGEEPLKATLIGEPKEPLKVTPIEEPETVVVAEKEVSEAESIKEEKTEPATPKVEEKTNLPTPKVEEKLETYTVPEVEERPKAAVPEIEERPKAAVPEIEERTEAPVPEVEEKLEPCTIPRVEEKTNLEPAIIEVVEKSYSPTVPEVEEKTEQAIHEVEEKPEIVVPEVEEKPELAVSKLEENPEVSIAEVEEEPEIVIPTTEEKSEEVVSKVEEKPELAIAKVEQKTEIIVPRIEENSEQVVSKIEEKPELDVPEVEDKPEPTIIEVVEKSNTTIPKAEENTVAEEIEKCEVIAEPDRSVPSETEEKELALPDMVKDITVLKEENIIKDRDGLTSDSSDKIVSTNPETPPTSNVVENIGTEDLEKEASGDHNVVEELAKEVEPIKAEEKTGEIANPSLEPDTKTSVEEVPKEIATKKQSSTILTKVKKTIVKAKRAILGKSPSSKVVIVEPKAEDIEVK